MYMLNERQRVKPCIEFQLVYFELALDFGYILNYSKNHKLMLHFKHPSLLISFYLADKKNILQYFTRLQFQNRQTTSHSGYVVFGESMSLYRKS